MYLEARAKANTPIMSSITGTGTSTGTVSAGQSVALVSLHKQGIESYYQLSTGGFVNASDMTIDRDVEFSSTNRPNRTLRSAVNVLGTASRFLTGSSPKPTRTSFRTSTTSFSSRFAGTPTTTSSNPYSDKVNAISINSIFRGNKTVSSLLKGATIGNVRDGSFFGKMFRGNVRDLLGGLINSRLRYVIGFDFSSTLENIFNIFGATYPNIFTESGGFVNNNGSLLTRPGGYLNTWNGDYEASSYDNGGSLFDGQYESRQMIYAEIDQKAIEYFKYKGCDGRMIIKRFGGIYEWEQDESYATPLVTEPPVINEEDVYIFKTQHDDLYEDTRSEMEQLYDEFSIHTQRQTIFNNFNRHRLVTPDNELMGTRGYVFFTRPDMNLRFINPTTGASIDSLDSSVTHVHSTGLMYNMLRSHPTLASYLMGDAAGGGHPFIPIFTDRVTTLDIADEVLETTEHGETLTGWKTTYGQSTIKSRTAGSVNITFRDDDMLSIYKMIKIWVEYINAVYRGEAYPNMTHAGKRVLDYAISIYYFLTKTTGEDLLYWCKFTGCYPTAVPTSNFSDSSTESASPTYTVSFNYAKKDDFNPISVAEFNYLSRDLPYQYIPTYNPNTLHGTRSFVGCPFVETETGGRLYRLRFRPPEGY